MQSDKINEMTKEDVINVLNKLPNEFTLDELIEKLIVIEKIDEGLKDNNFISHKDMKKIIWQ